VLTTTDRRAAVLGVLGGMGPAATAAFLVELAAHYPAATDQEHPRVLLLSDPAIPDRSTALLRGDDAPLAAIRSGLQALVSWGATLLAVPCNSAHFWVERLADELPCPVVSIIDATLDEAVAKSPEGAWLLATTFPLVNACTELPLAAAAAGSPGKGTISSVAALVRATIDALTASRAHA